MLLSRTRFTSRTALRLCSTRMTRSVGQEGFHSFND